MEQDDNRDKRDEIVIQEQRNRTGQNGIDKRDKIVIQEQTNRMGQDGTGWNRMITKISGMRLLFKSK
jgi:hypothetical protein